MGIAERAHQEVSELHAFFGQWYSGVTSNCLDRVTSVLAPDFELLSPSGEIISKQALLDELNAHRGAFPELRISVENVDPEPSRDGEVVVRYIEVHTENGVCERRRCCALLRDSNSAMNGLTWVAIGEAHDV